MTSSHSASPAPRVEGSASPTSKRSLPWVIGCLMLAMLMSSLGQTIFAAALPTIVGELGGIDHMSWVISGFLLGQTIALPIFGKLGDQIGRKGLFVFVNALYVLGSLIGGLANSMGLLIAARVMQGVAAGGIMILSQAITADVTTPRERGKYMGFMGSVFGVSSILGPVLGGWFTDGPGWRWGLWFNIPLGLIAVVAIMLLLKLPPKDKHLKIDWAGTATLILGASALVLTVTWGGNDYAWSDPVIIGLGIAAVVFAAIFVLLELREEDPLIPMHLFRHRNFVITTAAGLGIGIFMFGTISYVPTYLQMVHGMTPTTAGLMMITMMVGLMSTSIGVGSLVSKTGRYNIFPLVGLVILACALAAMSTLQATSPLWLVGLYLFIFGVGAGSTMQVIVLIAQNSFPVAMVGTVTAANNFFRQIGGAVGSALVGSIFVGNLTGLIAERMPAGAEGQVPSQLTPEVLNGLPQAVHDVVATSYNDALTPVFLLLAPMAIICALALLALREDKLSETYS